MRIIRNNTHVPVPGYPSRYGQPAAAITYQLNGTQVGRGNTLNLIGPDITFTAGSDKGTYTISQGISPVQTDNFHVTSAQLLDLFNTPVLLVPPPGLGNYLIVDKVILKYNRGSISYSGAGNTNVVMGANSSAQFGTTFNSAVSIIIQGVPSAATLTVNTGLTLVHTIGNMVNGDGDADITVVYQISTLQ